MKKQCWDIINAWEKKLKIPAVTGSKVNDILYKIRAMFDTADRKGLKTASSHFIERIGIKGQNLTIEYTFKKEVTLSVSGDPEGI